jgi:tRNA threonylcarbamoyladenosine biosynthesis protein TsaB
MLLALDTSTRRLSIALYDASQVIAEAAWGSNFHHTVELAPAAERVLAQAGVSISDVGSLAVALGPGSFTSLRTGLAFAKGLALSRNIPLIGVPSLDILAAAQPVQAIPLAAVLEAGRKRLAVEWYAPVEGVWQRSGQTDLLTAEELNEKIQQPTWVCGELREEIRSLLAENQSARVASPAASLRRAGYLAELAWKRWQAGEVDEPASLAPIYLSQERSP